MPAVLDATKQALKEAGSQRREKQSGGINKCSGRTKILSPKSV
jgi:hypothetical protein